MSTLLSPLERARPTTPLLWLPIGLGIAAVLSQIVYPLVTGPARDTNTIVTVLLFGGSSLSHAWIEHGPRTAAKVLAVFAGGGLAVELLGVATGFPFGDYAYADRIGPMVGDVPLLIPLAWVMLGYPALVLARIVTDRRWLGILVAAGALATWDLFLDPQMVAEGYWTWQGAGPYLIDTIPVTNYLAWLGTAWLMMAALWHVTASWSRRDDDLRVPVALYLWTWGGSTLAHLAFFDLPQSGVYGFIGMGVFVALLARAVLRESATPRLTRRAEGAAL